MDDGDIYEFLCSPNFWYGCEVYLIQKVHLALTSGIGVHHRSLTHRHGHHRPGTLYLFKAASILNPAAVVSSAIVYWCWDILFAWSFCACQLQLHLNHWIPRWRWRFRTVCLCSNTLATQDWPEVEIARTVSANWALMTSASVKHFLFVAILVHWHHHTIRC